MNRLDRCMKVLRRETPDRTPVFPLLMFFAADRAGLSYREFASNGEALANAQLALVERFPLDAITVCSDAFRITADLGAEMAFPEDKPPYALKHLVSSREDLERLGRPDPTTAGSRMADRVDAARRLAESAGRECLTLGWTDLPFAEACSACGVSEFLLMLMTEPDLAREILDFLTPLVIDFALAQLEAGAPMIGAGDAAASLLSSDLYAQFALPFEKRVARAIHEAGGMMKLHICGDTRALLPGMVESGADLINVDHLVPLDLARDACGIAGTAFKGNLNPVADLMQATPEHVRERARECVRVAGGTPYMLSAGCEIPAATPDEVFEAFCFAPQG
ncbi:uroporphyrinogen decarboxylase family protein [bacterium]|nr:uroporphyrinogen decarboxylase family protein [bacterium]